MVRPARPLPAFFAAVVAVGCTGSPAVDSAQVGGGVEDDSANPEGERGTLALVQLDCDGWIGESMLIVGPNGTSVLLDVGNDGHADYISAAVRARTARGEVDATVLTHFHEDHAGGFDKLSVETGTLVSRGDVGLDAANLPGGWTESARADLCDANACTLPWTLELGEGATFEVWAANGWAGNDEAFSSFTADDDGENARSLVGVVRWGSFSYLWNGDLTGGGKDTSDMENRYANTLLDALGGPPTLLHLGHHGIDSSTQDAWVAAMLPEDGVERAALVGTNGTYLDAPADEVLARLSGRVNGVWLTRSGLLTGDDPLLREAEGDVVVEVTQGGDLVSLRGGDWQDGWSLE